MNLPKNDKREFIILIIVILCLIGLMICMYCWGYSQCTSNINQRMHAFDDKGEECYTREEVDSFIYGDRWTEVY